MESPFEYRTGVILAEHSITDFGRVNSHQLRLRFDSARAGAIPAEHSITQFGRGDDDRRPCHFTRLRTAETVLLVLL